jgi:hypothetical protein
LSAGEAHTYLQALKIPLEGIAFSGIGVVVAVYGDGNKVEAVYRADDHRGYYLIRYDARTVSLTRRPTYLYRFENRICYVSTDFEGNSESARLFLADQYGPMRSVPVEGVLALGDQFHIRTTEGAMLLQLGNHHDVKWISSSQEPDSVRGMKLDAFKHHIVETADGEVTINLETGVI